MRMRNKIIEIIDAYLGFGNPISPKLSDQILALFPSLEGIEVVEKCKHPTTIRDLGNGRKAYDVHSIVNCPHCHGTGTITRPAQWWEVMEFTQYAMNGIGTWRFNRIEWDEKANCNYFILASGGRLGVKENV
jgi:hypothetical protein